MHAEIAYKGFFNNLQDHITNFLDQMMNIIIIPIPLEEIRDNLLEKE